MPPSHRPAGSPRPRIERLVLFGDDCGIPQVLAHLPAAAVVGLVVATIRPGQHSAVRSIAAGLGCPLLVQPRPRARDYPGFVAALRDLAPDLLLVNSYSMLLRPDVLAIPRDGGFNVHGGLLPEYRGANPIQWAILSGEREVGVTMHVLAEQVDAGDIVAQRRIPLGFSDTWREVRERLHVATDELLAATLPDVLEGCWCATPQNPARARTNRRRTPGDGLFSWEEPLLHIHRLVRALVTPLPSAFYRGPNGEAIALDELHSLTELAALKFRPGPGGVALGRDDVDLVPTPGRPPGLGGGAQAGAPDPERELWFRIRAQGGGGLGVAGLVALPEEPTAVLDLPRPGDPSLAGAVLTALAGVARDDLQASRLQLASSSANAGAASAAEVAARRLGFSAAGGGRWALQL